MKEFPPSQLQGCSSLAEFEQQISQKSTAQPIGRLYHRDGSPEVAALEELIAPLVYCEKNEVIAFSTGMLAVDAALSVGIQAKKDSKPPVLFSSDLLYSDSLKLIERDFRQRGTQVLSLGFGSYDENNHRYEKYWDIKSPDVVFIESIGNSPEMDVPDIPHLLSLQRQNQDTCVTVIDNTLPLSTGLKINELVEAEDKVIVVESGAKALAQNDSKLGYCYTKNPDLQKLLRETRKVKGSTADEGLYEYYASLHPERIEEFHERNSRLYKAAGQMATAIYELEESLGSTASFHVTHPSLANHKNNPTAAAFYPQGVASVFYIRTSPVSGQEFAAEAEQTPSVAKLLTAKDRQLRYEQSFGNDFATILANPGVEYVRISAGARADNEAVTQALCDALYETSLSRKETT